MYRKFLVNDRCLYRGAGGVSVYLRNVLEHWPEDAAAVPTGFCSSLPPLLRRPAGLKRPKPGPLRLRPLSALGDPRRLARRTPQPMRRLLQCGYARLYARRYRRGKFSASFEPNHLAVGVDGPVVTVIHDLSVLENPQWHPPDRVAYWRAELEKTLEVTSRWITVSQFTRRRMAGLLSIPPELVTVTPLAARPLPPPAETAEELPPRYVLHLGVIEPRKNIELLLDAWSQLPGGFRREVRLVLAGGGGWGGEDFFKRLVTHPVAEEVLHTGHVGERDTATLLNAAAALVAPSWYEGFGLPIVEAMAAGVPVLCSTAEAFAEVAGDAGVRLPPDEAGRWSEAIRRVLEDGDWWSGLSRAGRARAALFDWRETARRTEEVIRSVMP
ncbi:MAG: glycosyltransferase family 4 protein [Phycisphaerae bacterium]